MATKQSTVTSNEYKKEWQWEGKTFYTFIISFANGDRGEVSVKSKEDSYFSVGKNVDYTIKEKLINNDPLQKYNKIGKPAKGFGGGSTPKSLKEYKAEVVLVAMKCAAQAIVVDDKLTLKDFKQYLKAFTVTGIDVLKENWSE